MLNSELKKIERIGLKVNDYTDINGYRYFLDHNSGNRYFTVRVLNLETRKAKTLCTRGNLNTALDRAAKHIADHK